MNKCLGCNQDKQLYKFFCAECITRENYTDKEEKQFRMSESWMYEMIEDARDSIDALEVAYE